MRRASRPELLFSLTFVLVLSATLAVSGCRCGAPALHYFIVPAAETWLN